MNLKYTSPTFTFTQNKSDSSMTLAPTDKYVSTSAVYFDLEKKLSKIISLPFHLT